MATIVNGNNFDGIGATEQNGRSFGYSVGTTTVGGDAFAYVESNTDVGGDPFKVVSRLCHLVADGVRLNANGIDLVANVRG